MTLDHLFDELRPTAFAIAYRMLGSVTEAEDAVRSPAQVTHLRNVETNPVNDRLSASGFLAEIDRMQLEVREYLSLLPAELAGST